MEPSKLKALLLISMLFISSATSILGCGDCDEPSHEHEEPTNPKGPITVPPNVKPSSIIQLVTSDPVEPSITLPPVVEPTINLNRRPPPRRAPPPPRRAPPPPRRAPPPPPPRRPPPPPRPPAATCPIDILGLGACVIGIGTGQGHDVVVELCCPVLEPLVDEEAAECMCEALQQFNLNPNIYFALALPVLVYCGKIPPLGFTCSR